MTRARTFRDGDWRADAVSEESLQDAVRQCATLLGYRVHFAWLALHSAAGFPDLTLCRPAQLSADGRIIRRARLCFAELKRQRGKPTAEQLAWLADLGAIPGVEAYLWRVSDWLDGTIERILRGEEGTDGDTTAE